MENKSSGGRIGLCSLLGVAFIILKLCKVINWSWLWVLSPFWIGALIWMALVILLLK